MKIIKNIEKKELRFQFEGYEYRFEPEKPLQVEDDLYNYLKEIVPLAFDWEAKPPKSGVVAKAPRVKFKPNFPGAKFGIREGHQSLSTDGLPASGIMDRDGVEWYGAGIEVDNP